jgi:hypothetical protein
MRGPSGRLKHRVQRTWRCPRCGKSVTTSGSVTTMACPACPDDTQGTPAWMTPDDPKTRAPRPMPIAGEEPGHAPS